MKALLLRLSGADREVLADAPGDSPKYVGIGGTVLTTAVLAVLSSTFAVNIGLRAPVLIALLFGLAWGLAILNLDSWLVASSQRQPRWWLNILVALPRIALAIVIGAVISTPLVLYLFQPEIATELTTMHREDQARFEQSLQQDVRFRDLPATKNAIAALQERIAAGAPADAVLDDPEVKDLSDRLDAVTKEYDEAEKAVACEKDGTCGSGRIGAGPAYEEKVARRDRLAVERAQLARRLDTTRAGARAKVEQQAQTRGTDDRTRLKALQAEVDAAEQKRTDAVSEHDKDVARDTGLLARIEALHRLTDKHPPLRAVHLVLMVFLTALECLPVLVKLFLTFGRPSRYELLAHERDSDAVRRERLQRQTQYDALDIDEAAYLDERSAQARAHVDAATAVAKKAAQARIDLGAQMVAKWQAQQEAALDGELRQFLDSRDDLTSA